MQVFGLFSIMLAVAAAQVHQYYRNPGFRNNPTPLMPSASKERPYLSIPIVLMPDGQIVPKAQASYQYVSSAQVQPQPRNPKSRGSVVTGETEETYQVVVPPPPSFAQDQKQAKPSKNGASGRTMVDAKEQRVYVQNPQQNYRKYHHQNDRTQSASVVQFQNQRNPSGQQNVVSNQQVGEAHKQNVANFLNLATHLGTEVLSHHRGGQKNLYFNQQPAADAHHGSHGMNKAQETYVMQASPSQDQSNGFTYSQAQVQQNSGSQAQQVSQKTNVAQRNMQNAPQMQYQSTPASQPVQYVQASNIRQSNQGSAVQAEIQNQATSVQQNRGSAVYFTGNQNSPSQIMGHIQSSQQAGNQNYQVIQQGAPNVQLIPAKNYEQQTQNMYASEPVVETSSQDANTQVFHTNYGMAVQSGPAYLLDGHQVSFANAAHASPSTFQSQQNDHHNYQNSQQVPQSPVEQSRNQNMYASHQNAQDAGSSYPAAGNHQQYISSVQHGQQQTNSQQSMGQSSQNTASNSNAHVNQNGQSTYRNQPQTYAGQNAQSYETGAYTYASTQPTYSSSTQSSYAKYANPTPASSNYQEYQYATSTPASNNYQEYQYEYSTDSHRGERKSAQQESASPANGGQLIYASSSAKQINYSPSAQDAGQSQNNPVQSSAYVSFPSTYKQESSQGDAVSPESTYAKQDQSSHSSEQQLRATSENSEDEDVETSYKVVYIPLDILKNILSNSVENQRVEKSS